MTIKFKDMVSAQGCVMKMNGRFFDRRQVSHPVKFQVSTHACLTDTCEYLHGQGAVSEVQGRSGLWGWGCGQGRAGTTGQFRELAGGWGGIDSRLEQILINSRTCTCAIACVVSLRVWWIGSIPLWLLCWRCRRLLWTCRSGCRCGCQSGPVSARASLYEERVTSPGTALTAIRGVPILCTAAWQSPMT